MNKWIAYVITLGFAAYWVSSLLLWFPWSYSTKLGMTLMLTVAPVLWAYLIYLALKTYPKKALTKGSFIIALVLLAMSVIMDYIFFGLIRNAKEELYHPTTFYGYGFLLFWPYILTLILKKRISNKKRIPLFRDIFKAAIIGLLCFGALTLVIILGIEI
jgi:hypothetical protein